MEMLSSCAMAIGLDPGPGIIRPNLNLAFSGFPEVFAMDCNKEVLPAAEEVETQAASLAMSAQSTLQNWIPSGTTSAALHGHQQWHSFVLTPVP